MYTLLLDGSAPRIGLGIGQNDQLFSLMRCPFEAYEQLTDWLMQTLSHQAITPEDIRALGVVLGPGSYTGLRTSLLVIRTWAQTRKLPCWGCTHWELALFDLRELPQEILFVQAVKQSHFFVARGRYHAGQCTYSLAPQLIPRAELADHYPAENVCLVSPSADVLPGALPLRDAISILADWKVHHASLPWQELNPVYARPATLTPPRTAGVGPTTGG